MFNAADRNGVWLAPCVIRITLPSPAAALPRLGTMAVCSKKPASVRRSPSVSPDGADIRRSAARYCSGDKRGSRVRRSRGASSVFAFASLQPSIARRAKRGGGGRTRTCEAMRRLIYSQLPLPLGTLPRFNGARSASPCGGRNGPWRREGRGSPVSGVAAGRVYGGKPPRKSTKVVP